MALSNRFGHLVLSTGNKSEIAVGYSTLYGDMAGGYALISDVPKTLVYELAAELNRDLERIPRATIEKEPSAELRPDQKDSDSLPPYERLDPLVEALVDRALPVAQAARRARVPLSLAAEIADRIDRNEYKRRQMPPGPKVTARVLRRGPPLPDRAEVPWLNRPNGTSGRRSPAPPTTSCGAASAPCAPGLRLLDLGAAGGHLGRAVRDRCAFLAGVEPDGAIAASAREGYDDWRSADALSCGDWTAPFDAIVCADVLEHLPRPEELLARIRSWLRDGGTLLVSVPNVANVSVRAALLARTISLRGARHPRSDAPPVLHAPLGGRARDAPPVSKSGRSRRPRCRTSSPCPASPRPRGARRSAGWRGRRRVSGRPSSATSS